MIHSKWLVTKDESIWSHRRIRSCVIRRKWRRTTSGISTSWNWPTGSGSTAWGQRAPQLRRDDPRLFQMAGILDVGREVLDDAAAALRGRLI
jgi:hypothetical protein